MKTPRYTDKRYLRGYVPAARTDIQATFRRIRREMAEAEEKAKRVKAHGKVRRIGL